MAEPYTVCFSCGARTPDAPDGPTHPYMLSSPGCWALYGLVGGREQVEPLRYPGTGLNAHAYAVQHPGQPERRAVQSVAVHLIALYRVLELGQNAWHVMRGIGALTHHDERYHWLEPPASLGALTVADVYAAEPAAYRDTAHAWAVSAWRAWAAHHDMVRRWSALG